MENKINTNEELEMDMLTYKKVKGQLAPNSDVKITGDKPEPESTSITEDSGDVENDCLLLDDKITYVSNIKDPVTKKVVPPFEINGKKYQMVIGKLPNKEKVSGVYSFSETDDEGNNVIYSVKDFDTKIATPAKKLSETHNEEPKQGDDNYIDYKHFLVNKQNGNVRKFKTIKELVEEEKGPDDEYMGSNEFKQHMNAKLFGSKKRERNLNELETSGSESDEEMNVKAEKLMDYLKKNANIQNIIKTIKTPVAQREVIAAFAEMIGVPRNGLTNLLAGLKDLAKTPETFNENRVLKKSDLIKNINNTNE